MEWGQFAEGGEGGEGALSLTITLDFSVHNHGSTVSPIGMDSMFPEAKAVVPGPTSSLSGRGKSLEVNEWGLGEGTVSQTWRPQTRPKGRAALGI